ncbi:uncharacterized protein LOC142464007 [Ascaphus truei]|uniref:uncharacterized protein LOC142464007 n=1 Tax=Ascaphus truei TaxID=8439 RepID=UPI003F5AB5A5
MRRADRRERETEQKRVEESTGYNEILDERATECEGTKSHMGGSMEEGAEVFEGLCDRMLSALCLVQTNLSDVLDVKDELILQNVPSSVQTQVSICTSRLYRSLLDLTVPSRELVRLVRVFGPQWEQKLVILKQLQGEHERLQRLLSLALRRVQILEAQSRRAALPLLYRNWEKLFVRLMRMGPYKPSCKNEQDTDLESARSRMIGRDTLELGEETSDSPSAVA